MALASWRQDARGTRAAQRAAIENCELQKANCKLGARGAPLPPASHSWVGWRSEGLSARRTSRGGMRLFRFWPGRSRWPTLPRFAAAATEGDAGCYPDDRLISSN